MSTRALKVVEGGKPAALKYPHFVAAQLEEFATEQSLPWRVGDALVEDIGGGEGEAPAAAGPSGVNTGLHAKLEEAYLEAKRAGAREVETKTLSARYNTARVWPPETRVPSASFSAHQELNTRADRERRLRKLAADSIDGWVTRDVVRLWKSGLEPSKPPEGREAVLERRVTMTLKRWSTPEKFQQLAQSERDYAVTLLKRLAYEIEVGEFDA